MGRIADAFSRARDEQRAALVIYVCAGDPDLDTTAEIIAAVADAGADVVEVGMPFSDPTADGVAIQRASERSLARGTKMGGVLDAVRVARRATDVPVLLFGYFNPILAFGEERLTAAAADAGVDGFLVVDLPPEESASLRDPAVRAGLDFVPLVAPTSTPRRRELAAKAATSFLYYVSLTGVTGSAEADLEDAARRAGALRDDTGLPVAVGFGVRTPEDVAIVARHADGVVVGSAVVRAIEEAGGAEEAVEAARALVAQLAGGLGKG